MTRKEELEKEFKKYLKDSSDYYDPREPLTERKLLQMWLDCAEPREKRIAELEMTVGTLRTFSNEQATCIEKLEAQIEKMKCCGNCDGILDSGRRAEKCRHCMNGKKFSEWKLGN